MLDADVKEMSDGLLIGGIGLVLGNLVILHLLLTVVGSLLLLFSAIALFASREGIRGSHLLTALGLGLIVVGLLLTLYAVGSIRTPSLETRNALLVSLFLALVAGLILSLGVAVLPWNVASGAGRAMILGGSFMSILAQIAIYLAIVGKIRAAGSLAEMQEAVAAGLTLTPFAVASGMLVAAGYIASGLTLRFSPGRPQQNDRRSV